MQLEVGITIERPSASCRRLATTEYVRRLKIAASVTLPRKVEMVAMPMLWDGSKATTVAMVVAQLNVHTKSWTSLTARQFVTICTTLKV
jgi:hypothetical protein